MAVPADDNDAIASWIAGAGLFGDVEAPLDQPRGRAVMPWQGPPSRIEVRLPVDETEPVALLAGPDEPVDVSVVVADPEPTPGPEPGPSAEVVLVPAEPDVGPVGLGEVRAVRADLAGRVVAITSRSTSAATAQWFQARPGSVEWADGLRTARIARPLEDDLPAGHRAVLHATSAQVAARTSQVRTTQTDRGHVVVALGADGDVVGHALVPDGRAVLEALGVCAPWPGPGQWQWAGTRFEPIDDAPMDETDGEPQDDWGPEPEIDWGAEGQYTDEW